MKKNQPRGGGNGQKQLQPANNAQPIDMRRVQETAWNPTHKQQPKQIPLGKK